MTPPKRPKWPRYLGTYVTLVSRPIAGGPIARSDRSSDRTSRSDCSWLSACDRRSHDGRSRDGRSSIVVRSRDRGTLSLSAEAGESVADALGNVLTMFLVSLDRAIGQRSTIAHRAIVRRAIDDRGHMARSSRFRRSDRSCDPIARSDTPRSAGTFRPA